MTGPRYTAFGRVYNATNGAAWECQDCGAVITNQEAHNRFHSILGGHAWALAVLETAHLADHIHRRYDVAERIDSRTFDSWSADAFTEAVNDLQGEERPG